MLLPASSWSKLNPLAKAGTSFNIPALPVWSAAVRGMKGGTANARLLLVGDSTTAGGGAPGYVGAFARSYGEVLRSLLNAASNLPALNVAFFNNQNVARDGFTLPQYNPKVNYGSGWVDNTADTTKFGGSFSNSVTNAAVESFAPGAAFDTIDIWTLTAPGLGSVTVDVGGSTLATINENNSSAGLVKTTATVPLGLYTVNVRAVATAGVYMVGINTYNSAQKSIHIVQAGGSGAKITDLVSAGGFAAASNIGVVAPHLSVLCATINDWNNGTSPSGFQADTQSMITALKAYGDVILMTGVPTSTAVTSQAQQDTYTAIYHSLAASNGLLLIDMKTAWSSYAAANALGLYADTVHPSPSGYAAGSGAATGISQLVYNAAVLGHTP